MSLREKLGYSDHEEKNITPVTEEEISQRVDQINSMPKEALQKLIHPRISDIKAEIKSSTKCGTEGCKRISIVFLIMFAYTIKGFYNSGERVSTPHFGFNGWMRNKDPSNFERKAGHMLLQLTYSHHVMIHDDRDSNMGKVNPFGHKIIRTVFSLGRIRPRFINKGFIMSKYVIDLIEEWRHKEPTIDNHLEFMSKHGKIIRHNVHDKGIFCTCGYDGVGSCNRGNNLHSQEQYCKQYCSVYDPLVEFNAHPQFMNGGYSYCVGNIKSNPIAREAQESRNIFGYISNIIDCVPVVNSQDSRGSFEFFTGAIHNGYLLFDKGTTMEMTLETIKGDLGARAGNMFPNGELSGWFETPEHNITPDCYCIACLSFRISLHRGMYYDPNLLVFGKAPRFPRKWFDRMLTYMKDYDYWIYSRVEYFNHHGMATQFVKGSDGEYLTFKHCEDYLSFLGDIKIEDEKYHIKVSNYDNRGMVTTRYGMKEKIKSYYDTDKSYMVTSNSKDTIINSINSVYNLQSTLGKNRVIFTQLTDDTVGKTINDILLKLKDLKFEYKDIKFDNPYFPDLTPKEITRVNKTLHKQRRK